MKKLLSILLTVLLTSCESCSIDPNPKTELEKLPAATQTGKNTFGCLVNGKAWVTGTSTDALADYQSGSLQVGAGIHETARQQGMILATLSAVVEGLTYDLSNDPQYAAEFSSKNSTGMCLYYDNNTLSGKLTITKLDQTALIVSGLFEFTTFVAGCDTIKVTDGRFDLLYAN